MTDINWRPYARALTEAIVATGRLSDKRWRHAFTEIPRHLFVPRFYHEDDMGCIDSAVDATRNQWLTAVYSDDSLITQYAIAPGSEIAWPTSSATRPSLMAHMLGLLAVADGHRVWEIGTGTGYNAALLCHRLGDTHVTSSDIDKTLVDAAAARLKELDYHPRLVAGNATGGITDACFDRIIVTCAIDRIPLSWLTQLDTGGVIVTDLRGEIAGSLIALHKTTTGTVQGLFCGIAGHFMWLRKAVDNPLKDAGRLDTLIARGEQHHRYTTIPPGLLDDPDFRFFYQLHQPDLCTTWTTMRDSHHMLCMSTNDMWCNVHTTPQHGRYQVIHGDTGDLWVTVENLAHLWDQLGKPPPTRLGLTVDNTGQHTLWLDQPQHTIGDLPQALRQL